MKKFRHRLHNLKFATVDHSWSLKLKGNNFPHCSKWNQHRNHNKHLNGFFIIKPKLGFFSKIFSRETSKKYTYHNLPWGFSWSLFKTPKRKSKGKEKKMRFLINQSPYFSFFVWIFIIKQRLHLKAGNPRQKMTKNIKYEIYSDWPKKRTFFI